MKYIILSVALFMAGKSYGQTPATPSMAKSVGLVVFPAKNQSAEVQAKDDTECYKWAMQESGYDPLNPPKVTANTVDKSADGTAVKGAAKGAAAGIAIGSIAGEAGTGAAVGATTGALAGRRAKKKGEAKQQQANDQAAAAKSAELLNGFKKAFTVCLEAKGYSVK